MNVQSTNTLFGSNFLKLLGVLIIVLIFIIGSIAIIKPPVFFVSELNSPYTESYPLLVEPPITFDVVPAQATPILLHTIDLTPNGRKVIGNLIGLKDLTAAEAIRQRGGGQGQVRKLQTGYEDLTVTELANLAAEGIEAAKRAIKMIKQADKKAQKYGGK